MKYRIKKHSGWWGTQYVPEYRPDWLFFAWTQIGPVFLTESEANIYIDKIKTRPPNIEYIYEKA